jgi:hypothetical protein
MEPSSPIPSPFRLSDLFGYTPDCSLGAADPSPGDQSEIAHLHAMNTSYKKISGGGLLLSLLPGVTRLYLGADHLLLIEQVILIERYRRFYFRDIQAITMTKSARWIVLGVIWGVLALLSALLFVAHHPVTLILGTALTALFGFAFFHNILLGPTCIVRLQTAVQTHRFAPLERIRDFSAGMETIVPLIQNAQRVTAITTIALVLLLVPGQRQHETQFPSIQSCPNASMVLWT